jgi:hypothetical protein
VLSAHSYGVAKIAQKVAKDIAIVESHLFPDFAYGQYLDNVAQFMGIGKRHASSGSSTYVRLVGDPGTIYLATTHTFTGNHSVTFQLSANATIGLAGYTYALVRSIDVGSITNVNALTLNRINASPLGHRYVINEYSATGGRDVEDDVLFRKRIKYGVNLCNRGTLQYITQVFLKFNPNVLRVLFCGLDSQGKIQLAIVTQNGADLLPSEIDELLRNSQQYLNLTEFRALPTNREHITSLVLKNATWYELDITMRVEFYNNVNIDSVRIDIITKISKYFDVRYWKGGQKIEWDDLLQIVKSTSGVRYVADQYFSPKVDIRPPSFEIPRVRQFIILDLQGTIISDINGALLPIYFPNDIDSDYQRTILKSI